MKRLYMVPARMILLILLATSLPRSSGAQMLKNLVNNMKNSIGNKAVGKTDSTGRPKSGYDSATMAQLMARSSRPKPSISPADSAAAIKNFMTGTGGSGWLYQYRMTYTMVIRKKDSTMRDTMSVAVTDGHNVRSDMGMFGGRMQVLGHAGMPRYSVFIHPDTKTYVFNIIDTAAMNAPDGITYQVTRIGNETVQGYTCIHSKLTTIISGKTMTTQDIWTSTDVPGYSTLKSLISVQNVTPKMIKALEQAGCNGMFVKLSMQSPNISMDMLLAGAGRKTMPDEWFHIPAGYTQQRGNPFMPVMPAH